MLEFKKENLIKLLTKENIFLLIVIILFILIIIKILPHITIGRNIKMTILKQNGSIRTLDDPRNISGRIEYWINNIYFENSNELRHKNLGGLGFTRDFFLQLEFKMKVEIPQYYKFTIYSDDGFRLFINNNPISEFTNDRPLDKTEAAVFLEKGIYSVKLDYFQGYGGLGLIGYYKPINSKEEFIIGNSSKYIKFLKP